MGRGAFRMQLGPVKRLQEAIVADIEDDVLLGYDVLGNAESPADIILSQGIISLEGQEIPCIQKMLRQMRKVTVADEASVPGDCEAVIEVHVKEEGKEIKRAECIGRVASVFAENDSEYDTKDLSIRRIDLRQEHEGRVSDKVVAFKVVINKNDAASLKQISRLALSTHSNVQRNDEEFIKKKCVCKKRTSPWVSRLVRAKKKSIKSGDYRTPPLPFKTNEHRNCSCHDIKMNIQRNHSGLVSQLVLNINQKCDCDQGCSGQGQTTNVRQWDPLHAHGIRRSTPRRMSAGQFHQRYQTIHFTQDVVWAILPEASDDPLHTDCRMGHSTRGTSQSTPHRMSDESIHQRHWTFMSSSGNNM
ncbi:hypothetical protein DPMN_001709 [Dreissena polymorpha]|uniref:Uncharacterized protein n=1 Tax=Dreissena polymorpha TaxID=45954 RepID=A0A9D4RQK3_DREPO|nr:hypothetical protein DPMN_001709 [Dreissena polymorpha]